MQEVKQNQTKSEEAKRGAYERKNDDKKIEQEENYKNLRINLLIIREMLRVMCDVNQISINLVYEYLGISADQMTLFLTRGDGVKSNVLGRALHTLMQAGIPKKFLKITRANRIKIAEIKGYDEKCIDEDVSKNDKDLARGFIYTKLHQYWQAGNPKIKNIVFGCYRIINEIAPNKQTALFVANEALTKFLKYDFVETDIQTNDFAEFMKTLALSVEKTETLTDNPIHPDIQNSMQTISILLSFITKQDISKADAQSEPCLNMISEMAKTMLLIQETLLETSEISTP